MYKDEIFNLIQNAYISKGGFKGASTPRTLLKDIDLAKLVFDDNGNIIACALYRTDLGGYKRFGSAAISGNQESLKAFEDIIKSDIEPYDNWYWVEASGMVEKLFKKFGGNPIPNYIAADIIRMKIGCDCELDVDNAHYFRDISGERYRKMMFGFSDRKTYDDVMVKTENYNLFKKRIVNPENELLETMNRNLVQRSMALITSFFDLHREDGLNEMTVQWENYLKNAVEVVKSEMDATTDANIVKRCEALLKRASTCFEEMTVLKPHKIEL